MDNPATAPQKRFIRLLLEEAGYEEADYVTDFTGGQKASIEALTIKEASDVIKDLKEVLGWD